jgi:LDH2 family malate/lactate/ureidoglycolate dehydrogenase
VFAESYFGKNPATDPLAKYAKGWGTLGLYSERETPSARRPLMLRVAYPELVATLSLSFQKLGFESTRAALCARLFADSSRDGVHLHGFNRFPSFVAMIKNGGIDIHASPVLVASSGPLERWDGRVGPGNLNAWHCMDRAIALARQPSPM